MIKASDAGIVEAHKHAADYYFFIKKDYVEGERRLRMISNSFDKLPVYEAKNIIDMINHFLMNGNELTDEMSEIIDSIVCQGYIVTINEDGFYQWSNKRK